MNVFGYLCAAIFVLLGLLFLVSGYSTNLHLRYVPGAALLVSGIVLAGALALTRPALRKPSHGEGVVKRHANPAGLVCTECGATLTALQCREYNGAMHVRCSECGAEYDMEDLQW